MQYRTGVIVKKLLQEISYEFAKILLEIRTNFNMQQFKKLQTTEEMIKYADANLKKLGEGSTRAAYLLSNRYVLKIAIPSAEAEGVGQNKGEFSVFSNPSAKNLVAAIYDHDPGFKWLVSEIARPMKSPQEFGELTGVKWDNFSTVAKNYKNWQVIFQDQNSEYDEALAKMQKRVDNLPQGSTPPPILVKKMNRLKSLKQELANLSKNPILLGAVQLITKAGLMPGDVEEWDHWAKTADGRIILIDYGFTRDVYKMIYKNKTAVA